MTETEAAAAVMAAKLRAVFEERFSGGDPRSAAYKAGFRTRLMKRLGFIVKVESPYPAGTAEFDAYHAGDDDACSWRLDR